MLVDNYFLKVNQLLVSLKIKKMKHYIIVFAILILGVSAFGQQLDLEKASPFTAINWKNNKPIVQFNNQWYQLEKIEEYDIKKILTFCKTQFGRKWKRRFSEDLVEVFKAMNYKPTVKIALTLSKNGSPKNYTGVFTEGNRRSIVLYNREKKIITSKKEVVRVITLEQAIEDINEFKKILETKSSYSQLSKYNYNAAIQKLKNSLKEKNSEAVDLNFLTNEMAKIMAEIGDRHSSIKNTHFKRKDYKCYDLNLPFGVIGINNTIAAVKYDSVNKKYKYLFKDYPYIKSIHHITTETLLNLYSYKGKKAPEAAKQSRGASSIERFGALLFKNNVDCPEAVEVVFTNGNMDIKKNIQLTTKRNDYISTLDSKNDENSVYLREKRYDLLTKVLDGNIGYISIPAMTSYRRLEGFETFIENTVKNFSNKKALIIDVRNNPGGSREVLQTFANFIVQPAQSPWVANVAYLRTNDTKMIEDESMNGRYLYAYSSSELTNTDRKSIEKFNKKFKLKSTFDTSKFSSPFYMVLHNGEKPYSKPIYILVNEKSFSAATVFTSAFKGLPNVKIVGITTDGSSGNSKKMYLSNSGIRVKVSTMLSFQRNGKTLDGNGTIPDIIIPKNKTQVMQNSVDTQLNTLVQKINRNN
jgi:C-terminal processing protease CtpA/Prc